MAVNAIGWIVLGLITGLVTSKLVNKRGEGLWRDVPLSIVGAVTSAPANAWSGSAPSREPVCV